MVSACKAEQFSFVLFINVGKYYAILLPINARRASSPFARRTYLHAISCKRLILNNLAARRQFVAPKTF